MNGPRFVRTGRCRLIICCGILVLVIGMIAVFHSSQLQLDETKQERLHCEQQQEALNERLTSLVEQKFHLEKHHERERTEQLENRRNLEQTIKELEEKLHKDKLRYDKLETTHKNLQKEQDALKLECLKSKKLYEEEKHKLEANLQRARSELQKEKDVQSDEMHRWKEKYNTVTHEKEELEASVDKKEVEKLHSEIKALELELQKYHPTSATSDIMGINKPIHVGDASNRNLSVSEKSFSMQEPVGDGVYHITINVTEKSLLSTNQNTNQNSNTGLGNEKEHLNISNLMPTIANMAKPPYQNRNNRSLILNSVENFQIVPKPIKTQEYPIKVQVAPLGAPKNKMSVASSPATRSDHQVPAVGFATSSTTPHKQTEAQRSSNSPPLVMPPNQKKLPENVAPIPDNFETLLEKTNTDEVKQSHHSNVEAAGEIKSPKDDEMFHHYSMDKKIQEPKALALKSAVMINNYEGMAAHDIKHHDNGNDQNFMMSNHNDDGAHFFDGENHKERGKLDLNGKLESAVGRMSDKLKDDENDDEEMGVGVGADNDNDAMASLGGGAAGDIAVKQSKNQLLDSDNLNNEVAADQGKEFGDLRMDEGDIDDGDDDDYSNPGDRIQGGKAIRN